MMNPMNLLLRLRIHIQKIASNSSLNSENMIVPVSNESKTTYTIYNFDLIWHVLYYKSKTGANHSKLQWLEFLCKIIRYVFLYQSNNLVWFILSIFLSSYQYQQFFNEDGDDSYGLMRKKILAASKKKLSAQKAKDSSKVKCSESFTSQSRASTTSSLKSSTITSSASGLGTLD